MYQKKLPILFILFFPFLLLAQTKIPIKWGKIDSDDLKMTVYEKDSTAQAVVLIDYGTLEVIDGGHQFVYVFKHHKRIKILDKNEVEQGNISIPYYSDEKVYNIKAQTINPDGTKSLLNDSAIFEEDLNENFKIKKFSIPSVQEGSIIEYQYEKRSPHIVNLEEWYFQGELPVRYSEFSVDIYHLLQYTFLFQGKKKEENSEEIDGLVEINENQFIMRYAPALKEEAYITSMDNYRAKLRFQLSKIHWLTRPEETYMSTWEELAEELKFNYNFGKQYTQNKNFSKIWAEIESLLIDKNRDEKIKIIYEYVQDKFTWDSYYSRYTGGSLNELYKERKGNIADLNLLLVALLNRADIPAKPMLCGTRSRGLPTINYPIVDQFHYVLAYIEEGEETLLLDASSDYFPLGFVRNEVLNYKGWVVDDENSRWEAIRPQKAGDVFWTKIDMDEEGNVTGNFKGRSTGYSAISERNSYFQSKGGHWKKRLEESIPDLKIDEITYEGQTDIDKPFSTEINFTWQGASQKVGDFLYIKPVIYTNFGENPFKLEERLYPVEFPYPFKEQIILNINIPEGYEVEALPDNINIAFPDKAANFRYLAEANEKMITLTAKIEIQRLVYQSLEYKSLKTFFDGIVEAFNEQIVLKKK